MVVGRWDRTPFGTFSDVMVEDRSGHRVLLAPNEVVADLLQQTYRFDEVVIGEVSVATETAPGTGSTDPARGGRDHSEEHWRLSAPGLEADLQIGSRTPVGWLLRAVPRPLATSPRWLTVINPAAAVIMNGVRTRGSVGPGRTEFYGAYDVRSLVAAKGRWRDADLGDLAPVEPPVRFGFGSTPTAPTVTSLITTIRTDAVEPTAR